MRLSFILTGKDFMVERFNPVLLTLKVASFNDWARKVYERAGFHTTGTHGSKMVMKMFSSP
jgi:hypothetical protein